MSATVLIAAAEHLPALRNRADLGETIVFTDAEALRALDVITRQRPNIVALERLFAATTRGAALINRIKADPSLSACEIRIVAHDTEYARVPANGGAAATAVAEPQPVADLDVSGTRRTTRFKMGEGIEILLDGNPATLVDLSLVGAQVLSPTILRPNQRLRVSFPDPAKPTRVTGAVAWASFEMPKGGPRYRAGIEFFDPDEDAIVRFCDNHKA